MIEKTLKSDLVYEGYFLKIQKDEVLLPNGKIASREYILHPGASLVVPVFADFETLLIRQYRQPLKQVFWEFPAGKKDPGESALTTAKREFEANSALKSRSRIPSV